MRHKSIAGVRTPYTAAEEVAADAQKSADIAQSTISDAKTARSATKIAPISVDVSAGTGKVFDVDPESRINIVESIENWTDLEAVAGGTGTLPWTLSDNNEIPVTLADLKAVRSKSAVRGLGAHQTYQAIKNA